MTGLSGIFKAEPVEARDSDKLLDLYWNRAELKKEFAALRNEKYQLQDRIKQHQGATARVQQKLDHVENLLLDPEWVHNVVAFYQLRRLAVHCHAKLERFAEQIKQQREHRIHSKLLASWNDERAEEAAHIERKIGECRLQVQLMEDHLQSERHRLMTMSGFAKIFRGRKLSSEIDEISARIDLGHAEERELLATLQDSQTVNPPDHVGLDTSEKRSINFMILSFTQHLYLHYAEDNLAALAKEASEKSVGAIRYGTKFQCDEVLKLLEKRWDAMEKVTDLAEELQKRVTLIMEQAMFRHDDDVIPIPASVATVYDIDPDGIVTRVDGNVLGDNFFGIAKVLSR